MNENDLKRLQEKAVRLRPRSKAPSPMPRVVLLGPGAQAAAAKLAVRIGAVFVDSFKLAAESAGQGFRASMMYLCLHKKLYHIIVEEDCRGF